MSSAKDSLGRAAAALVQDGETVVLDSGTTTQYIARHLAGRSNLVVSDKFSGGTGRTGRQHKEIHVASDRWGLYRRISHDLFGSAVEEALGGIYADRVFFGAAALSFTKGAMNFDQDMPRAILQAE